MKRIVNVLREHTTWIIVGGLVGLMTLSLAYRQVELNRKIASSNFLLELSKQFESEEYRRIRKNFCQELVQSDFQFTRKPFEISSADKIYGFFELMGLLKKERALSLKEIDTMFGDYLEVYYEIAQRYGFFKYKNKEFLSEFRALVGDLRKEQKNHAKWTEEDVKEFIQAEAKMETF